MWNKYHDTQSSIILANSMIAKFLLLLKYKLHEKFKDPEPLKEEERASENMDSHREYEDVLIYTFYYSLPILVLDLKEDEVSSAEIGVPVNTILMYILRLSPLDKLLIMQKLLDNFLKLSHHVNVKTVFFSQIPAGTLFFTAGTEPHPLDRKVRMPTTQIQLSREATAVGPFDSSFYTNQLLCSITSKQKEINLFEAPSMFFEANSEVSPCKIELCSIIRYYMRQLITSSIRPGLAKPSENIYLILKKRNQTSTVPVWNIQVIIASENIQQSKADK
ncbi:hypothetical protein L345_05896, partial [Ophiophagus hannah]